MSYQPTASQIKPFTEIKQSMWQQFCSDYPWTYSSRLTIQGDQCKQNDTLLATVFASILDSSVCWCQHSRIVSIYKRFAYFANNKDSPDNVKQFLKKLLPSLTNIIQNISLLDSSRLLQIPSQSERTKLIKQNIEQSRQYIMGSLQDAEKVSIFARISRAIILTFYLEPDFSQLSHLQKIVKSYTRSQIIQSLINGQPLIDQVLLQSQNYKTQQPNKNFFILEDLELLPISFLMQLPIYFYMNHYDEGASTLTKRRVHASNEEQAICLILDDLDQSKMPKSIKLLQRHHPSIYIKTHQQYYATPQSDHSFINDVQNIIDNLLQQTTFEYSNVNEFWIKKIVEIIQMGDAETLIAKKNPINLTNGFMNSLYSLTNKLNIERQEFNRLQTSLSDAFKQTLQIFENLVIAQVTIVRDAIMGHIKQIKSQSQILIKEQATTNKPPIKPKILEKSQLFNKQKSIKCEDNQTTHTNSFIRQKNLANQSKIIAKDTDQDLPDLNENLTESEFDSELQSYRQNSQIDNDIITHRSILVPIQEYHTSDDEDHESSQFNYHSIINQNKEKDDSDSGEQIIQIEDVEEQENQFSQKPPLAPNIAGNRKKNDDLHTHYSIPLKFTEEVVEEKNSQKLSIQQMYLLNSQKNIGIQLRKTLQGHSKSNLDAISIDLKHVESELDPLDQNKLQFTPNNSRKSLNIKNRMSRTSCSRRSLDLHSFASFRAHVINPDRQIK